MDGEHHARHEASAVGPVEVADRGWVSGWKKGRVVFFRVKVDFRHCRMEKGRGNKKVRSIRRAFKVIGNTA